MNRALILALIFLIATPAIPGLAQDKQVPEGGRITEPPEKSFPGIKLPEETSAQQSTQSVDLSRVLVGRWEGEVFIPRDINPPGRVLEVRSVTQQGDKWLIDAQYGILGRNLSPVDVSVDRAGGETVLEFRTGANAIAKLTLSGRLLAGPLTLSGMGTPVRMRLGKVK
jgi:hypothetical protein